MHRGPSTRFAPWVVVTMVAILAVPAAITLATVRNPGTLQIPQGSSAAPYGYSVSLLLFIIPSAVILFWLIPRDHVRLPRQAFWRTVGLLAFFGILLDFFFAGHFFVFPDPSATLGIPAPAIGQPVPVEEYVFYTAGFLTVLLLYVWLSEYWLAAYNIAEYRLAAQTIPRLLQLHAKSAIAGAALILAAVAYRKLLSGDPDGFPSYFLVLVAGGFIPSVALFATVGRFVNWRAFSLTLVMIVLVSLLWEATLAVPYGWWGYQSSAMMGLYVGAWARLPVEAIAVWIAVTYATVIVFEAWKVALASEKPIREAFLGARPSGRSI